MRDSFIFYRGFFESFSDLSKKDKLILFDALCNYALNDVEPELVGVPSAMFKLLKPQVDANNRRYENGLKGGRPKKNQTETKAKPNNNRPDSKPQPNVNDNDNVNDTVNVNDNVNDNHNDNHNYNGAGSARGGGDCGDDSFDLWKKLDPDDIDAIYDKYPETGGLLIQTVADDVKTKKKTVKNPRSYILGYAKRVEWNDAVDNFAAPWEA